MMCQIKIIYLINIFLVLKYDDIKLTDVKRHCRKVRHLSTT